MKKFSFNKIKKILFPVELPDGSEINIHEPRKKDIEILQEMAGTQDMEVIAEGVAAVMSANQEGRNFTADWVLDTFSITDMTNFMTAYMEYLGEILPKN